MSVSWLAEVFPKVAANRGAEAGADSGCGGERGQRRGGGTGQASRGAIPEGDGAGAALKDAQEAGGQPLGDGCPLAVLLFWSKTKRARRRDDVAGGVFAFASARGLGRPRADRPHRGMREQRGPRADAQLVRRARQEDPDGGVGDAERVGGLLGRLSDREVRDRLALANPRGPEDRARASGSPARRRSVSRRARTRRPGSSGRRSGDATDRGRPCPRLPSWCAGGRVLCRRQSAPRARASSLPARWRAGRASARPGRPLRRRPESAAARSPARPAEDGAGRGERPPGGAPSDGRRPSPPPAAR